MSFVKFPPTNTTEAVAVFNQDVIIIHDVAHGAEDDEVLTENGAIPSIAKFMKDAETRIADGIAGLDHQVLGQRSAADCHPISAITNLQTVLDGKASQAAIDSAIAGLSTVATTGDYGDLTNTPNLSSYATKLIPSRQITAASENIAASDLNAEIIGNSGSAQTFTITDTLNTAAAVGDKISVIQFGAGVVSIAVTGAQNINGGELPLSIITQYQGVVITKIANNVWCVTGAI